MANRLAQETSPYLKQHQDNPVDWYPWSSEALERARREDKPILLSIGYSACHWCHVMAHESFENEAIACQMNEGFINIKVDREERPDLDQIYQNVAQALTGGGGWPLTVFLLPDQRPFFGGTYFPPEDRYGRPGFPRLLDGISRLYRENRGGALENARRLMEVYTDEVESGAGSSMRSSVSHPDAARAILSRVDRVYGGFAGAPKFPMVSSLEALYRSGLELGMAEAHEAALFSAEKIVRSGTRDQLGGGFHRYAVDERWEVPHFEKMLYDNGLLLRLLSEMVSETASETDPKRPVEKQADLFVDAILETVRYLLAEMRSPCGAFYSAQDADSEGHEGKYFVWKPADLLGLVASKTITEAECLLAKEVFGISEQGNFEGGATVLQLKLNEVDQPEFSTLRTKLLDVRRSRVAPMTDTKLLVGWNGLVISGLAWAGAVLKEHSEKRDNGSLEDQQLSDLKTTNGKMAIVVQNTAKSAVGAARDAFEAIVNAHRHLGGSRLGVQLEPNGSAIKGIGFLDDYAFMARAALDLARFERDPVQQARYIGLAASWMDYVIRHFGDGEGGFYTTGDDHEALIHRPQTTYDQATPCGSAVVIENLISLAELDAVENSEKWAKAADEGLKYLNGVLGRGVLGQGAIVSARLLAAKGAVVIKTGVGARLRSSPNIGAEGPPWRTWRMFDVPGIPADETWVCTQRTCKVLR